MTDPKPTALQELAPPEAFTLEPPPAVAAVPIESASGKVKLDAADVAQLDEQVQGFIDDITQHDAQHPKFKEAIERIHSMGNKDIEASAAVSNRMLDRPVGSLKNGMFDQGARIGQSLIDLRRQIEDLDPSRQGDLFSARKLLGLIPLGNQADRLLRPLPVVADAHQRDHRVAASAARTSCCATTPPIEQEQVSLWTMMERLEKYAHMARSSTTS